MSARPEDVIISALQTLHGKDPEYDDGVDARAILAALHAAGLVVEQGWQPISTAPRDAMLMTGHNEDTAPIIGYYHRGAWREHNGKGTVIRPTHWRPLPQPPKEGNGE